MREWDQNRDSKGKQMSKQKNLLILDDEKDIAEVISELAEDEFDNIFMASDGGHALEILKNTKISVILSDISMPLMTGDVFLKKMRALGYTMPIVFLTGHGTKELAIAALKLGASDFLEKPFNKEHLLHSLNMAIDVEEHKRKLIEIEVKHPDNKEELIANEKKFLGIKQAARTLKKTS